MKHITPTTIQFKTYSRPLLTIISILTISACSNNMNDLEQFIEITKGKYQGSVEPLPQFEPYQSYIYSVTALRDPFLQKVEPETNAQVNDDGLSPDSGRRKELLENFPMDSLSMVGTLQLSNQTWGLIRDPEGKIHRVKAGNHAGENYGEIISITETRITFLEIIPDGLGSWIEREVFRSLSEE